MSDHDPLCDWYGALFPEGVDPAPCPDCAEIRRVRADERERIAQAIEEAAALSRDAGWHAPSPDLAFDMTARIARNGGQ